ncbi:argininosuccinate lyase [Listeria fleischmannii FSL S10-1203]|uniref:Argininosuccinate lyase n=1 Tax=Listeria fleischmannii FSL S10-1203 TaxID=1265822 RepID=W7DJL2_9LIST|nr:argininosuccinate lyase [Listeria fleischmannii FSL S10-1203]
MEKLWGGRFEGVSEDWIDAFGASIPFDQKLASDDITGSLAHVKMLSKTGIISEKDAAAIISGLETLQVKLQKGELSFTIQNEDIHLNIEKLLHDEIGAVAGKLHTARSRNDQVATDMHLYLKRAVKDNFKGAKRLKTRVNPKSRRTCGDDYAWLYAFATCAADFVRPSPARLL